MARSGANRDRLTYLERSNQRLVEADALIGEVAGLHPVLEGDLARAAEIAARLRELADAQRQEIVPDADLLSHKVLAWRTLDLRAHRAADMATYGHDNCEWFEREEQEVVQRGKWRVTEYDKALMRFSGEPLSIRTLVGPGLSTMEVAARVLVICACLAVAVLLMTTISRVTGVLSLAAAFGALWEWLRPLFDDPAVPAPGGIAESCPGIGAYCLLADRLIESTNEQIAAANPDGAESGEFAETFSTLEIILNQMRRVVAPPLAQSLHKDVICVAETYLEISRGWSTGRDVRAALVEAEALGNRANESLAALTTRCP